MGIACRKFTLNWVSENGLIIVLRICLDSEKENKKERKFSNSIFFSYLNEAESRQEKKNFYKQKIQNFSLTCVFILIGQIYPQTACSVYGSINMFIVC